MKLLCLLTYISYTTAMMRGSRLREPDSRRSLQITTSSSAYWPYRVSGNENKIYVPVTFDTTLSASRRAYVETNLNDLSEKVKYIDVIFYDSADDILSGAYVIYQDTNSGCYAGVGYPGDSQSVTVNLGSGCWTTRTVQHEFMHTLGVFHEHSRSDRDNFISVLTENIASGYEYNFYKRTTNDLESPFDFNSIMIYSKKAFSKNGSPTLQKINDTGYDWGTPSQMSTQDIRQLQLMYRCPDGPRNESQFCDPSCRCPEDEGPCYDDTACNDGLVCDSSDNLCKLSNNTNPPVSTPVSSPTTQPTHYPTKQPTTSGPTTNAPTSANPTANPTSFPTFGGTLPGSNAGVSNTTETTIIIVLTCFLCLPLFCILMLCIIRCYKQRSRKTRSVISNTHQVVYTEIPKEKEKINLNRLNIKDMPI